MTLRETYRSLRKDKADRNNKNKNFMGKIMHLLKIKTSRNDYLIAKKKSEKRGNKNRKTRKTKKQ